MFGELKMAADTVLVSDVPYSGDVWEQVLIQLNINVIRSESVRAALDRLTESACALVIVDAYIQQSQVTHELIKFRELRAQTTVPILLLLSNSDKQLLLRCYEMGVDDCIVWPVDPLILLAKVQAWLRRSWVVPVEGLSEIQLGELALDPENRQVTTDEGTTMKLTNLEFRLLHLLMIHPRQILTLSTIVDRVWGYNGVGDASLIKHVVYRLRRKIEPDPGNPRYLLSVPGEGYMFHP